MSHMSDAKSHAFTCLQPSAGPIRVANVLSFKEQMPTVVMPLTNGVGPTVNGPKIYKYPFRSKLS